MGDDEKSSVEDEFDVIEKVEEYEKGWHINIKSKRGTGTNDRDEVQMEQFSETKPDEKERMDMAMNVTQMMNMLRMNQPVEESEE